MGETYEANDLSRRAYGTNPRCIHPQPVQYQLTQQFSRKLILRIKKSIDSNSQTWKWSSAPVCKGVDGLDSSFAPGDQAPLVVVYLRSGSMAMVVLGGVEDHRSPEEMGQASPNRFVEGRTSATELATPRRNDGYMC